MGFAHRSRFVARGLPSLMLVAALQAVAATAHSAAASAADGPTALQRPLGCEPATLGRDRISVVCVLDGGAAAQRVHIKIHLTGSHDDTTASMEVAIGDVPVACVDDSKTSTEGEDGDVALDCRFTVSVEPGAAHVLRASAKWFHAQYVGLEINGRRP